MKENTPKYHSIYTFLWSVIRPFKWHYAVMLVAPILGAFYDFANNYALKLVVDAFSGPEDVLWRASDVAEWRSEPYVRQNILLEVYDHVQHHPYQFFQNTQSGSITTRINGILDGYDHFWAAMHHDFTPKVANTVEGTHNTLIGRDTVYRKLWEMQQI